MTTFFGELERLRRKPIPSLVGARERRKNYRQHPIDTGSAHYKDEIVDLNEFGVDGHNYYHRINNPPYYKSIPGSIGKLLVRKSVAARLAATDQKLREHQLKLCVFDCIRPIEVQKYFHDVWRPQEIKKTKPHLAGKALVDEVEKYWAAPSTDDSSPAPHASGGAVDLTIAFLHTGAPLYLGSIFDDVSELAHTDYFEEHANAERYSDLEAQANRRLLFWTMAAEGFANNPNEWWHFSWGDQMWAKLSGETVGFFGLANYTHLV